MPSKRSSGRRLGPAQHEFLIDRSLGRLALVTTLRSAGLVVRTLAFADQAACFMTNRHRIIQAAAKPGPYLYGVYKDGIKKLWPPDA